MQDPTLPAQLSPLRAASILGTTPLTWIPSSEIPQPFQKLLVHDHDMTSELAAFHGDALTLTVHQSHSTPASYLREVTLHTATTGTPIEYGLIEILLDAFPPHLHPLILTGKTPLGAILNASRLPYHGQPQGFFTVPAPSLATIFPNSPPSAILHGRYNHLISASSKTLARIIEILPSPTSPPP